MKIHFGAMLLSASLVLAGCGGGSSSSGVSNTSPPPPPADQETGGLWVGTLTSDSNMVTEDLVALSADDGRFRFLSVDSDITFVGISQTMGTSMTGTARAFADSGVNWLNGNHVVDATVTAVIAERSTMSGSWALASGESFTFDLTYDALYEKDSATSLLEDIWTGYDDFGNPEVTFVIDADGVFNGQNTSGCVSTGQFTAIAPTSNLYEVQGEISNCGIAGTYQGFAFLADLVNINDGLLVSIDNDQLPILIGLER